MSTDCFFTLALTIDSLSNHFPWVYLAQMFGGMRNLCFDNLPQEVVKAQGQGEGNLSGALLQPDIHTVQKHMVKVSLSAILLLYKCEVASFTGLETRFGSFRSSSHGRGVGRGTQILEAQDEKKW